MPRARTSRPWPSADADAGGCGAATCLEFSLNRRDDGLDTLSISHTGGRDLPAEDVYVTGVASDHPPELDRGRTVPWHEVGELDRTDAVAGRSVPATIGFVETVRVLWRLDGCNTVLEEFQLY